MTAKILQNADLERQLTLARDSISTEDYAERVYSALLGKVLGVYIGRPFEGWDYRKITERFGQIDRYVAEEIGKLIVVTDDDIAGTMTFIRAAADSGRGYDTNSWDVAEGWLNYLIEGRSVLWWGGMGNSTEHTAYLRLKAGYRPPESGSAELNGKVVSEQIGAQIFIDGWGLIAPGASHLAAELARRAAMVSHDGEAVFGAQMIAAMEATCFTTKDINEIIDAGLATIPSDSIIARLVADIRDWHSVEPDWRNTRALIEERYGYHRYGGGCHMIPNHGLVILALLYSDGDFSRGMTIVNTSGWDTDCNSGNVGALLGLIGGLESIDREYDWRGPVADRLYVPTADSGGGISDVATEARRIARIARSAAGLEDRSLGRPRFTFEFPGSVQGFRLHGSGLLRNSPLPGASNNDRGLRVIADGLVEVTTPTFIPLEALSFTSYPLDASPTIYSGQQLNITYYLDSSGSPNAPEVVVTPILRHYDSADEIVTVRGQSVAARPGFANVSWTIPDLRGQPICEIGLAVEGSVGRLYIDSLGWTGSPTADCVLPGGNGEMWRRSWVTESDFIHPDPDEGIRLISNGERRLALTGAQDWRDYRVEAALTPHAAKAIGIAARVQGLRRYYLVRLADTGEAQLLRRAGEQEEVIASLPVRWRTGQEVIVRLDVAGDMITAHIDGALLGSFADERRDLAYGGIALSCEGGRLDCSSVRVTPLGLA